MESKNSIKPFYYLVEGRNIPQENVLQTIQGGITFLGTDSIKFIMKDLDGNITGSQIRKINPGSGLKSYTAKGSKVSYFYKDEINYKKEILITEGEIDFLSLSHIDNVIGLQGIKMLPSLIEELQERGAQKVILLVDQDEPANNAIDTVLESSSISFSIFDGRKVLGEHKDVNDLYLAGGSIDFELILKNTKELTILSKFNKDDYYLQTTRGRKLDHNAFAKHIVYDHHIAASDQNCFQYDTEEGIRRNLSKQEVQKLIIDLMETELQVELVSVHDKNAVYDFLTTHAENESLKHRLELKYDRIYQLNLKDGIYDIREDKVRKYRKDDFVLSKLQYGSDDLVQETPERFLRFLDEIFEGYENKQQIINFLQEFIGYLFVPCVMHEKALLLYGSGCNGKGVLLAVIKHILGKDNCEFLGLHEISKEQNTYLLIGKLTNIDSDMQHGVQLDSSIIKKLISGEQVTGKIVYSKPISFSPYARLLVATNDLPYIKNIDNSIKRRFVFLHLKQCFLDRKDPQLKKELCKESSKIFSRSIRGLKKLVERGHFEIPGELEDDIQNYIKESDSIESFLESGRVGLDENRFILYGDLYEMYSDFCKSGGFSPLGSRRFNSSMRAKGFNRTKRHHGWGFEGIGGA